MVNGLLGGIAGGATVAITIKAIDNFSNTFNSATTGASKLSSAFKTAAIAGVAAGAAIAGGLAKIGLASVSVASDFEETSAKFETVFSSISEKSNAVAKDLQDNYGLSSLASRQLLSDTGDLLSGFGFAQDEALGMSEQVNKLAVDLASFTNYSGGAEGASAALTKALLGERESLKSLGIAITETDLKQRALNEGLDPEALTRQEKAALTLAMAMDQSKNAIGDFARTSDSLANQTRILKADFEDLKIELGKELIPVGKELVSLLIKDVLPALKPLIPVIADLLTNAIKFLIPIIKNMTEQFVGLATFVLQDVLPTFQPLIPMILDLSKIMFEASMKILQALMPAFQALLPPVIRIFEALMPIITVIADIIVIVAKLIAQFADYLAPIIDEVANAFEKIAPILTVILKVVAVVIEWIAKFIGILFDAASAVWDKTKPAFDIMVGGLNALINPIKTVIDWYNKLINVVKDFLGIDSKASSKSSSSSSSSSRSSSSSSSSSSRSSSSSSSGFVIDPVKEAKIAAYEAQQNNKNPPPIYLNDFIVTKGGKIIKPSPNDTIIGTKNGLGGGQSITINIGTINGSDPTDIAQALQMALSKKVSLS